MVSTRQPFLKAVANL